jgi:type IV pilus assembly protein PilB
MPVRSAEDDLLRSLVEAGLISSRSASDALAVYQAEGMSLVDALVSGGALTDDEALQLLELQLNIPFVRLENTILDSEAVRLIPEEVARRHNIIAISRRAKELTVAVADPLDVVAEDEVRRLTGLQVRRVLAKADEIRRVIERQYVRDAALEGAMREVGARLPEIEADAGPDASELEELGQEAPVVALVNSLLVRAMQQRASDLHIEPGEHDGIIRCRVDGVLRDMLPLSMRAYPAVVSRVKILGGMDISERRVPQDGRFSVQLEGRPVDFRVSTLPTVGGEKVVMRVLDAARANITLAEMGIPARDRERLEAVVSRPHGMFVVTGPTGSGKTTTLYAVLQRLNSLETNILTCEDPVEYQLGRINQVQLNVRAGLTFGTFLRSALRQDPDIIMVGEMRDAETAELGIRAALTGHLVLTTLHTNDAVGAATRLVDMGVEPYLVASTLQGALAQRLVRTICQHCKEAYMPKPEELALVGVEADKAGSFTAYQGRGCRACNGTGYAGRQAVFELFVPDAQTRRVMAAAQDTGTLMQEAVRSGMTPLREAALSRVVAGETTILEAARVTV